MKDFLFFAAIGCLCAMALVSVNRSTPIRVNDGLRARLVADAYARNKYGETANVVSCDNKDIYGTGFVPCYGISRGTPFEFLCGYKTVATGCKDKEAE